MIVNIKLNGNTHTTNTSNHVFCYIHVHKIHAELLFLSVIKVADSQHITNLENHQNSRILCV